MPEKINLSQAVVMEKSVYIGGWQAEHEIHQVSGGWCE